MFINDRVYQNTVYDKRVNYNSVYDDRMYHNSVYDHRVYHNSAYQLRPLPFFSKHSSLFADIITAVNSQTKT